MTEIQLSTGRPLDEQLASVEAELSDDARQELERLFDWLCAQIGLPYTQDLQDRVSASVWLFNMYNRWGIYVSSVRID